MTTFPSIQNLVDLALRAKQDYQDSSPYERTSLWNASSIGYCPKRQYLEAIGAKKHKGFDDRTLRIFHMGKAVERAIRELFYDLGILVFPETPNGEELALRDPDLRLGGRVDSIIGGPVSLGSRKDSEPLKAVRAALVAAYGEELPIIRVELKSTHSNSWHWAKKQNRPVASQHQRRQGASYALMQDRGLMPDGLEAVRDVVVNISKDDLMIDECGVTGADKQYVLDMCNVLNECYDSGTPPECTCTTTGMDGREWKYCPYYPYDIPKGRNPEPIGACCEA